MRVIAGSARRLNLETPKGTDTRPTLDREKETLFNMLQSGIAGSCFLDLFSGSGQIGIEALSRGASSAYFVEQAAEALACIRKNLTFTRLQEQAVVMARDVCTAIPLLESRGLVFDYIFMDPPYGRQIERDVLLLLAKSSLVTENTQIIVESDLKTDFEYTEGLLNISKMKCYKTNKHTFFVKG
ncbi:MAG: 16S rRNA (guanine(966)-N(2))-methyltransferase RsmD [Lachnospiraceae bacterium]|nr:16S rRNA (guanine(966)-N(2))-methyltransferase RsmD [Lachnospiraceae bacterium]